MIALPNEAAIPGAANEQLFFRQWGGQGPVVVLIHGIPTNSFLWHSVGPFLGQTCTVIAPDLLGYGQSPAAPAPRLTLPSQARYILGLLDRIGVERAHFVGHDLGGGIVQILATQHPERVQSITVIDGVCFSNWPVPQVVGMRWPTAPEFEPGPLLVQTMLRLGIHNQSLLTPDLLAAFTEPFDGPEGAEALRRAGEALEHHQTEEVVNDLPGIRVPVTILWGQYDRLLPAYWGQRLQQAIPTAQMHLLQGCGHFGMLDNPTLVAQELVQHLDRAGEGMTVLRATLAAHPQPGLNPPI